MEIMIRSRQNAEKFYAYIEFAENLRYNVCKNCKQPRSMRNGAYRKKEIANG